MLKLIVSSILSLVLLTACSQKNSNGSGSASACGAANGAVAPLLAQKGSGQPFPGEYRLVKADYVYRKNGFTFVVGQTYDVSQPIPHDGSLICPGGEDAVKLSKALDGHSFAVDMPDTLSLKTGELELPDNFDVLTQEISFRDGKINIKSHSPRATTAADERITNEEIRKRTTVIPTNQGIIVKFGYESGEEFLAYFKLLPPLLAPVPPPQPLNPAPISKPRPQPEPTKEQCLEKTGFKLGPYTADYVRFVRECSLVIVTRGKAQVIVRGAVLGGTHREDCHRTDSARVAIFVHAPITPVLQELQRLNPGISVRSPDMPEGSEMSWQPASGGNKMEVPLLGGYDDPENPKRRIALFNGALSGEINLGPDTVCRLKPQLRDYVNHLPQLAEELIKEFAIEFK